VAGLNAIGQQVVQAVRESGVATARVVLAPGGDASAVVHAGAVPSGAATCPPDYVALLVTLPDRTVSARLQVTLPACAGLTVRALVTGADGQ
jgi:hypothetical protein